LLMDPSADASLKTCFVRLDVILEARLSSAGDARWEQVDSYSCIMGAGDKEADLLAQTGSACVPALTDTTTFEWKVSAETAYLKGMGNVTDPDIVLPTQVYLSLGTDGYIEDPFNGQLYSVEIWGDAFSGCDFLRTVTFQDGAAILKNEMCLAGSIGMFSDCPNLIAVNNIPQSVTSMNGTFKNCTALEIAPVIPDGVTQMVGCFKFCTALAEIPEIPESVLDLRNCFNGCTAMQGTAVLPKSFIEGSENRSLEGAYENCISLEAISAECCPKALKADYFENSVSLSYLLEHVSSGLCTSCHIATGEFEADGLTVYMDEILEEDYLDCMEFLDQAMPEDLKAACSTLTITYNLNKYDIKGVSVDGFATFPEGNAYVKINKELYDPSVGNWNLGDEGYTVSHELAHCFDTNYSTYPNHSYSAKWQELHNREGAAIAEKWYDPVYYAGYTIFEKRMETFAMAVGAYFAHPQWLEVHCPGMYAYVDAIWGNE